MGAVREKDRPARADEGAEAEFQLARRRRRGGGDAPICVDAGDESDGGEYLILRPDVIQQHQPRGDEADESRGRTSDVVGSLAGPWGRDGGR